MGRGGNSGRGAGKAVSGAGSAVANVASAVADVAPVARQSRADIARAAEAAMLGATPLSSAEKGIQSAYLAGTGGKTRERMYLSDLHDRVGGSKADFERHVLSLADKGKVVLYRDDTPARGSGKSAKGEMLVGGQPRHLIYFD